ncbi:hypothetical protein FRC12_021556 [Ceratobasidium sp. 428]|nr:hypothetical protein FRC12_021556 [Ceratobasidium sp. 428]
MDRRYRFCVSCQVDAHASWSRECPAFLEECRRLNQKRLENYQKYFDPERVDPPAHQHVPASPAAHTAHAAPVAPAAPAAPVAPDAPVASVMLDMLLADIIREDGTVPAASIPAYFPARQKSPPPPAKAAGHVSPPWDSESKSGTLEVEELPRTPIRKESLHFYLSTYRYAPPRSRSSSVSSVSTNSSVASTVAALSRQVALFPGGFDSFQ